MNYVRRRNMIEIKAGKGQPEPDRPPVCRCQCSFSGPWFPLEFQAENLGLAGGTCGCACPDAPADFTWLAAKM